MCSLSRYLADGQEGRRTGIAADFSHRNWVVAFDKDSNTLTKLDLNREEATTFTIPLEVLC